MDLRCNLKHAWMPDQSKRNLSMAIVPMGKYRVSSWEGMERGAVDH